MIPVYQPWLTDLEKKYANEALDSSWISSTGKFIDKAEELFAEFIGVKHCIVTTSGTTALHLCLRALDLPHYHGDTRNTPHGLIAIPNTTFVATAFAADYDRRPIEFIDADSETWNINLDILEKQLEQGCQYHAVIPVHLYGNPCNMWRLKNLQDQYGFKIVEDACESLGATIDGRKTGTFGDISCFSFYANKTLASGEGGAVVTDNDQLAYQARLLRGQAQDVKRYWHVDIGYNYRMTNVQAAILCAQLERADEILSEKERVSERYRKALGSHFKFQKVLPGHQHSSWLTTLELPVEQSRVALQMAQREIDTRKVFYPISEMPPYSTQQTGPVAKRLSEHGISLPSYPQLTNKQIDFICKNLLDCVKVSS